MLGRSLHSLISQDVSSHNVLCVGRCVVCPHSLLCFRFGIPLPDTGKLLKGRYAEEESCNTGGHQYDDGDDSGEDAYRKGFFSMV